MEGDPRALGPALRLAQLHEWTGDPGAALDVLERAAALHPDDRGLSERVVSLALATGETPRAVGVLERLARSSGDPKHLERAVDALVAADRAADAVPLQRRLVEQSGGAPSSALKLAGLYDALGREREAIEVYERLDRQGALSDRALHRLADLYRFQARPLQFLRLAERLLVKAPGDDHLRALAVETALGAGRADDAIRLLRAAPGADSVASRMNIAKHLTDLGRHPEAITEYRAILTALSARPDGADALAVRLMLARLYDWTGAPEQALAQWEAVLRATPRDPGPLREVGRRSLALSRSDVALAAYGTLLAARADDPEALKRVGQLLAWGRDPRSALRYLERFNQIKGGDYEVHFLLGELYRADRDEARARAEYERALRLLPRAVHR